MVSDSLLSQQLDQTLVGTNLPLPGRYQGKVRDTYDLGDQILIVATDRLSAFDVELTSLPFKGQILNQIASFWFEATKDVAPNHVISQPDPTALLARKCKALPVEVVVRGYITGSLWRDYLEGKAGVYGIDFPKDLKKDQAFDHAIITPSTKAPVGEHDEPISCDEVVTRGLVPADLWEEVQKRALALFARGQELALEQGLILVDTKYEFGLFGDELLVIDEIHTPDSSRFWEASEYEERFAAGKEQRMLDKENLRQWLIQERGFKGQGPAPEIPADVRVDLARKYVMNFERLTGKPFEPAVGDPKARLEQNLRAVGILR
ncbi:phosphoribosylaminoimidazolesuccinocarboxamide synthase [Vulgatibacter incomptus]|uniref:Phosphoribosylaminoimidazole-succinocarboxamide synthase n=1 Tax=Vulgatibacter incomptus TaxID=1391653 RepID=A0A0K1PA96_9BACT|nr:phosphoribosylaminoimidazolesuccinocarboxamide synthase [Vulgatibacter incomptus]AKU90039.1 Phosphoribosylaminoimidazole-succinocarboxamide synthase [Vulgatibacter incomptus]